jgi:hypothetical protein
LLLVIGVVLAVALGALVLVVGPAVDTITLLLGFTQAQVATSLQGPTNMAFAPEGRIFVTEQNGAEGGRGEHPGDYGLLPEPFPRVRERLGWRASPARDRVRPAFRHEPVPLRVLYDAGHVVEDALQPRRKLYGRSSEL